MAKRMLIDATHAEETRVVVLDGNRLEDFDVESANKKQLKGNIYLAKVVRVEPSLQAAFVEYGGGRHGFLAFGEIHPDYYQIPVADRQRLLAMQAEEAREDDEADDEPPARPAARPPRAPASVAAAVAHDSHDPHDHHDAAPAELHDAAAPFDPGPDPEAPADSPVDGGAADADAGDAAGQGGVTQPARMASETRYDSADADADTLSRAIPGEDDTDATGPDAEAPRFRDTDDGESPAPVASDAAGDVPDPDHHAARPGDADEPPLPHATLDRGNGEADDFSGRDTDPTPDSDSAPLDVPPPETIGGGDDAADADEMRARRAARFLRNYRIQEVIKRRQIMLVQVVKEERGTKGAALTTYISLAGRFCVLMPNSPRGGGISRKITSAADRKRLKEIMAELDVPSGMGLIVRTAGANRPKPEIKRDCEYLMRLWDDIREHTLRSVAPALIYEEASLIKRAIRDVYSRDVDDVLVDGEEGWRAAHDFMRMLMPSHAKKVQLWRGNGAGSAQPLFAANQVEAQLDAMLQPTVQLRSGGYVVINQTEALVAIDVNSGRATRERNIEETALRTNLEAADEIARQLRLRDLAGLIVIDFIDMEQRKNNAAVERRLKDALKADRARIQVGHISHFGLLEMSRQRLRPSLAETSFVSCPHCGGMGHVRSTESAAINALRAIEEEGSKGRAALITVRLPEPVALYLLNHKRARLGEIEQRYGMLVHFVPDAAMGPSDCRIERTRAADSVPRPLPAPPVAPVAPALPMAEDLEEDDVTAEDEDDEESAETEGGTVAEREARAGGDENAERRRRRRRRRRGGRRDGMDVAPRPGTPDELADARAALAALPEIVLPADEDEAPLAVDLSALPELVLDGEPAVEARADDAGGGEVAAGEAGAEAAGEEAAENEQPLLDPAALDENGLPKAGRRRGRRGGRRRRREDGPEVTAAAPAEEYVAPVYTGPTPADPFGGGAFDIFDMLDQDAEPQPAPRAAPRAAEAGPPAVSEPVPAPEPAVAPASAPASADEAPAAGENGTMMPAAVPAPVAPMVIAAEPVAEAVAPAAPEPTPAAPDVVVGPAIQPVVIGDAPNPGAERRRGWWRRG